MKRGLLDVNVLVALLDPNHPNHEEAHEWFGANRRRGWATCPTTINGCVRVLSHPSYPTVSATAAEVVERLRTMCSGAGHLFWSEETTLLDKTRFRVELIPGSRAATDVYLLGVAVHHGGRLVSFDRSIPLKAVAGAEAGDLVVLGGGNKG